QAKEELKKVEDAAKAYIQQIHDQILKQQGVTRITHTKDGAYIIEYPDGTKVVLNYDKSTNRYSSQDIIPPKSTKIPGKRVPTGWPKNKPIKLQEGPS